MSAVQIACVVVSALALVLACALVVSARANRRRTAALEAQVAALAEQVRIPTPAPPEPVPVVHVLEPLETSIDDQGRRIAVPTNGQIVDATLGQPLVRAAALGHGLRRALRPESRDRIAGVMRREFRRRRKLRMKAGRRASRLAVVPMRPGPAEQERAS
jgi:type VI protein secretion system component VasK